MRRLVLIYSVAGLRTVALACSLVKRGLVSPCYAFKVPAIETPTRKRQPQLPVQSEFLRSDLEGGGAIGFAIPWVLVFLSMHTLNNLLQNTIVHIFNRIRQ